MEHWRLLEPWQPSAAETRLVDAWALLLREPLEAGPLPPAHQEWGLPDAYRMMARMLPAAWRRGRCRFRTLARRPSAGIESLGLGTRRARRCAGPKSLGRGPCTPDSRIP